MSRFLLKGFFIIILSLFTYYGFYIANAYVNNYNIIYKGKNILFEKDNILLDIQSKNIFNKKIEKIQDLKIYFFYNGILQTKKFVKAYTKKDLTLLKESFINKHLGYYFSISKEFDITMKDYIKKYNITEIDFLMYNYLTKKDINTVTSQSDILKTSNQLYNLRNTVIKYIDCINNNKDKKICNDPKLYIFNKKINNLTHYYNYPYIEGGYLLRKNPLFTDIKVNNSEDILRLYNIQTDKKVGTFFFKDDVIGKEMINFKKDIFNNNTNYNIKEKVQGIIGDDYNTQFNLFFDKLVDVASLYNIPQKDLLLLKFLSGKSFDLLGINYDEEILKLSIYKNKNRQFYLFLESLYGKEIIDDKKSRLEMIKILNNIYKIDNFYINLKIKNLSLKDTELVRYGKHMYNVFYIPDWKLDIYKKYNLDKDYVLTLASINNVECGRIDGFCFNGADVGPFQINQIHDNDFRFFLSYYNVVNKCDTNDKECLDKNGYSEFYKKTKDEISKELFEKELVWTLKRFDNISKKYCNGLIGNAYDKCLAILHNGNNAKGCYVYGGNKPIENKYCYAEKVVFFKNKIKEKYF